MMARIRCTAAATASRLDEVQAHAWIDKAAAVDSRAPT